MKHIEQIKELTNRLNYYRQKYYNENVSVISDYEYDALFDELKKLEDKYHFAMSNSPIQTVGYEVKSSLSKIQHSHAMLSLNKTKSEDDLKTFAANKDCLLSLKLDGLTILLTYNNGELIQAETRGNGVQGELITHNAKVFENIPLHIDYQEKIEIEGEAIIKYTDFEKINDSLSPENQYKNPRNLVSGSVRQLNSQIAAQRHINFLVWKVPYIETAIDNSNSFIHRLLFVKNLGFEIVPLLSYSNQTTDKDDLEQMINHLRNQATDKNIPIDGLVMTYNDIVYGESLGVTGHHPKHSIAFKFYDEEITTTLKDVEWTMGKSGTLTPTAVFEPVEIDGTMVERASLHNVSIFENLRLSKGDTISVYKANMIIPQVKENLTKNASADKEANDFQIIHDRLKGIYPPDKCPICGGITKIQQDNDSKVLICDNPRCKGKLLGKCVHFVSKSAMNIDGLSEATLSKLIDLGYVESFIDIYELKAGFYDDLLVMDGMGKKSVDKLMDAIEASKNTTLERFINALSIPMIGKEASKTISKYFEGDFEKFYEAWSCGFGFKWTKLEDFGNAMHTSMANFALENMNWVKELASYMNFQTNQNTNNSQSLSGKIFVITGSLNTFTNRDAAKERIESFGGKVAGSVSAKTTYLVNNDITSTSGKNKKAKELGIPIITEAELIEMLK